MKLLGMENKFYENYWSEESEKLSDFSIKWPKLKQYIPLDSGITVFDFGCGHGSILKEIAKINPAASYIGVDVSENGLNQARKNLPTAVFHKINDGGRIPLEDNSVDFIFSSEVLEHVYETENAFFELSRVLKPGGKFLLTVPYHGFIKNLLIALFGFDRHFDPIGAHIRFFSKKTLFNLLNKFGFNVIKYGYYGRFWPIPHSIWVLAGKSK